MRDIMDRRPSAPRQENQNDGWWFKGLLFVAAVAMTVAHFGLQRSFALERAAVGERNKTLAELVQQTKRLDKLRKEDSEKMRAQELERFVDYSDEDRAGLAAIIEGGE